MARPDPEAIGTFMTITSVSEAEAIRKLEEHQGDLNEAVNAHFSDGDRNGAQAQDDSMDIDDPVQVESHGPPNSQHQFSRDLNPFSLLDSYFTASIFDTSTPFVSHPGVVREIPNEVRNGEGASGHASTAPIVEDSTGNAHDHGPEIHGTVALDDDEEDDANGSIPNAPIRPDDTHENQVKFVPSAPSILDIPDNDIEKEMLLAAIEASKQDAEMSTQQYDQLDHLEDTELANAVSLSLQTAENEKVIRELYRKFDFPEQETQESSSPEELGKVIPADGRASHLELGSSSIVDEADNGDGGPVISQGSRNGSSSSIDMPQDNIGAEVNPPSSSRQNDNIQPQDSGNDSPSAEDDEYLASADREKESMAKEETEAKERHKAGELHMQQQEEEEIERQLAAKEASLPQEPAPGNDNSVTLLVRMPDGSRRGRRFVKSDKLQFLFDFIDVCRGVKPGGYRLVRSFPRRAFGDVEATSSLNDLGFTSKHEALYLELI